MYWQIVSDCTGICNFAVWPEAQRGSAGEQPREEYGRMERRERAGVSAAAGPCLPILRVHINAKKKPLMKRFLFSVVRPLWLLRFFLRAVNVPSILLLVFGIPPQSSRWQVKRHGR